MSSALNTTGIRDAVASAAAATGMFNTPVLEHEPVAEPGNGLTAAVTADRISPAPIASGLAATSVLLLLGVRLYTPLHSEPRDATDITLSDAVDALLVSYIGGFTLGGLVRDVDVNGEFGTPLEAVYGYVDFNGAFYRVATITVPVVVNDVWVQAS
jgi:hypothetical protein